MSNPPDEKGSPENEKGAAPNQENAPSKNSSQHCNDKVIRSRSTRTETQIAKHRILLRQGPKTTDSLRTHGISHPAGRVNDPRTSGCLTNTENVRSIDSDGFTHSKTARYSMLEEVGHGE